MGFELAIFILFALIAVVFAVVVVAHPNPVAGALSLVASFFALAVMYVLLDAPFMAALQVIVYAGAIMVLFLFVLMLLNPQVHEDRRSRPIQQFLGWTGGVAFALTLIWYLMKVPARELPTLFQSDVRTIGVRLFESYLFPFEMVSILLIAAIVGALMLTQRSSESAIARREQVTGDER